MNVSNAVKDMIVDKTNVNVLSDVLQRSSGDIIRYLNENHAEYVSKMFWIMNIASILMIILFIMAAIFLTIFIKKIARRFNKSLFGRVFSYAIPSFFVSIILLYVGVLAAVTLISIIIPMNTNMELKGTNEVHTQKVVTVKNIYTENPIDDSAKDNENDKYNYITYELDGKTGLAKVKRNEFKLHMPKNEEKIKIYTNPAFVDENKVGKYNKDVDQKLKSTKTATLVHLSKDTNENNGKNAYWLSVLPDPKSK